MVVVIAYSSVSSGVEVPYLRRDMHGFWQFLGERARRALDLTSATIDPSQVLETSFSRLSRGCFAVLITHLLHLEAVLF